MLEMNYRVSKGRAHTLYRPLRALVIHPSSGGPILEARRTGTGTTQNLKPYARPPRWRLPTTSPEGCFGEGPSFQDGYMIAIPRDPTYESLGLVLWYVYVNIYIYIQRQLVQRERLRILMASSGHFAALMTINKFL